MLASSNNDANNVTEIKNDNMNQPAGNNNKHSNCNSSNSQSNSAPTITFGRNAL